MSQQSKICSMNNNNFNILYIVNYCALLIILSLCIGVSLTTTYDESKLKEKTTSKRVLVENHDLDGKDAITQEITSEDSLDSEETTANEETVENEETTAEILTTSEQTVSTTTPEETTTMPEETTTPETTVTSPFPDFHVGCVGEDNSYAYLVNGIKMCKIRKNDIGDNVFTKLIYSITVEETDYGYAITQPVLNEELSLFRFSNTNIDNWRSKSGCENIENRDYSYTYNFVLLYLNREIESMCSEMKTERDNMMRGFEVFDGYYTNTKELIISESYEGLKANDIPTEEIEYKCRSTSRTYPLIRNEPFILMKSYESSSLTYEDILTPKGILQHIIQQSDGSFKKIMVKYIETDEITGGDDITIINYGNNQNDHGVYNGVCFTEDCKYMCIYLPDQNPYHERCYKKANKDEVINGLLKYIDTLFDDYINKTDSYVQNLPTQPIRLLQDEMINDGIDNVKGYYYENVDNNKYISYFVTPTSFIHIYQENREGKYIQMKMVKTLENNELSFTINSKSDYNQSESGFVFEVSENETCKGFISLEYINI